MAAPHPLLILLVTGETFDDAIVDLDVAESARQHGVAALVDRAVTAGTFEATPDAHELLTMASLAVAAEHRAALATTEAVISTIQALGIDVAIFKGVATAALHYEVPEARPTIDVDAFVAPHDIQRMGELVAALGASDAEATAIDAMVAEGRVFEHTIPTDDAAIDLHRDPMNMVVPTTREQERWDRTITVTLSDGAKVRTLDLEDRIIQALLHLFRDNFADLLHAEDVRRMIDAGPDWDEVERRAADDGWTDLVRYALWFVTDVYGRPSPLPTTIARWRRELIHRIWPRDLCLRGAGSLVRSERRQSALGLLAASRPDRLAIAYTQRVFPARSVIDARAGSSDDSYPVALARWRATQRRALRAWQEDAAG